MPDAIDALKRMHERRGMTREEGHAKAMLLGYEYHYPLNLYRRKCADQSRRFEGCAYFEYVDVDEFHVVIERRSELDQPLPDDMK